MTVSSLANKTWISPNTSGYRGAPSKITIHHTAGVISADGLGSIFSNPARQASCNYGIGNDGEIICILEEEYHPWTSSNYNNDHAAVTFEVSNSYAGGDWPVGGPAWDSMIRLAADICDRWGIDPEYDGSIFATYTEHRMFAGTACPGDYIHARMNMIVQEVKAAMNRSTGQWEKDDRGWWYKRGDGSYPYDKWELIDNEWYLFDSDGYMLTGWQYWDGSWYYLKKNDPGSGKMMTGWQNLKWNGKICRFYFLSTGAMVPGGFHEINGKWYAFDDNGVLITDDSRITVSKKTGKIQIS